MMKGRHVILAPVTAEDSSQLFAWINDRDLVRLHGPFKPVDKASHEQWMRQACADNGQTVMAIREAPGNRLIGLMQLVNGHDIHRSIELRIRIGAPGDRGKGLGREAVNLACRHATETLGMQRVFLHVFSDNAPAIAAYEAAGFVTEGVLRKAAFIEGEWKDVVVMARLTSGATGFTEADFRTLIEALKRGGYRFASYGDALPGRHVLWRHDIDMSVHRAAALASIEAEAGVKATYFFNPRSMCYNLLEPAVADRTRAIIAAGHDIGLHFDAEAFGGQTPGGAAWTRADVERAVATERQLLETIIGRPVAAVSWHNPDMSNVLEFGDDHFAGLHNAYSQKLRTGYTYASDSNGHWRFKPMLQVIEEGHERLHLLTHPEWWTRAPMTVDQRVDRAFLGRAWRGLEDYYALLRRGGRNHGKS
jgi:RimJ/RimL family protein N-acetyltransferase